MKYSGNQKPRIPARVFRVKKNFYAEVAQSVEQRTENPCVDSSILSLGIIYWAIY
jgi:hypothetical protein